MTSVVSRIKKSIDTETPPKELEMLGIFEEMPEITDKESRNEIFKIFDQLQATVPSFANSKNHTVVTLEQFRRFFRIKNEDLSRRLLRFFLKKFSNSAIKSPRSSRYETSHNTAYESPHLENPAYEIDTKKTPVKDTIPLSVFLRGVSLVASQKCPIRTLKFTFQMYDQDGDGILSSKEIRDAIAVCAEENEMDISDADIDHLAEVAEKGLKKGGHKVSFERFKEEFIEHWKELQVPTTDGGKRTALKSLPSTIQPRHIPTDDSSSSDATESLRLEEEEESLSAADAEDVDLALPARRDLCNSLNTLAQDAERIDDLAHAMGISESEGSDEEPLSMSLAMGDPDLEVEKPSKSRNCWQRTTHYLHQEGFKCLFIFLFLAANIFLFVYTAVDYASKDEVMSNIGASLPISRAAAAALKLDTGLILLLMCRNLITFLRRRKFARLLPLDKHIVGHRHVAVAILILAVVHIIAHYVNAFKIEKLDPPELNEVVQAVDGRHDFETVPSWYEFAYTTVPGITGHLIVLVMLPIYIFALARFRRSHFEVFWYLHHLFIVFYVLLIIHGMKSFFAKWSYYWWILIPGLIYIIERIVGVVRTLKHRVKVVNVVHKEGNVLAIEMKPRGKFKYKAGQYIQLKCPRISRFQYHPFTLTSCPEEENLSVHIRCHGNWTSKLSKAFAPGKHWPELRINGPFGAPSEDIFKRKTVMAIGLGIGVTPFASILKHTLMQAKKGNLNELKLKKIHFYWSVRSHKEFHWFNEIIKEIQESSHSDFLEVNTFMTGTHNRHDMRSLLLYYALRLSVVSGKGDRSSGLMNRTFWGRPDFNHIIRSMREQYTDPNRNKRKKIGVFFCGSQFVSKELYKLCRKSSDDKVSFLYRKENF